MKEILVAIAGGTASGKTTVAEVLAQTLPAKRVKYSDVLIDFAQAAGIDHPNKAVLQDISNDVRARFGNSVLADALGERLKNTSGHIIIEGNRLMDDMTFVESFAQKTNRRLVLLYIDATPDTRFKRINMRLAAEGSEPMTREAFDALEADPCEVELPQVRAHITERRTLITNETLTLNELHAAALRAVQGET